MTPLVPHPTTPDPERRIVADAAWTGDGALRLRYRIDGPLDDVVLPTAGALRRGDRLWSATCMEAFVSGGTPGYVEVNVSPSRAWATYAFLRYREGGRAADATVRAIDVRRTPEGLAVDAHVDGVVAGTPGLCVGLSVVIARRDGLVYWALRHPAATPDFHHPEAFALDVPADVRAEAAR